jgi:chaperonin GroES
MKSLLARVTDRRVSNRRRLATQWQFSHSKQSVTIENLNRESERSKIAMATSIRPLNDRIIVKRLEEQEQMRGGLYIPDTAKEKPQEGEVLAVGNGKLLENGTRIAIDLKVGDRVLFGKYAGTEVKLDGEELLILREDDVLGVVQSAAKGKK